MEASLPAVVRTQALVLLRAARAPGETARTPARRVRVTLRATRDPSGRQETRVQLRAAHVLPVVRRNPVSRVTLRAARETQGLLRIMATEGVGQWATQAWGSHMLVVHLAWIPSRVGVLLDPAVIP